MTDAVTGPVTDPAEILRLARARGAMIATALIYAAYPLMQSAWGMAACSILLGFALGRAGVDTL